MIISPKKQIIIALSGIPGINAFLYQMEDDILISLWFCETLEYLKNGQCIAYCEKIPPQTFYKTSDIRKTTDNQSIKNKIGNDTTKNRF